MRNDAENIYIDLTAQTLQATPHSLDKETRSVASQPRGTGINIMKSEPLGITSNGIQPPLLYSYSLGEYTTMMPKHPPLCPEITHPDKLIHGLEPNLGIILPVSPS